MAQVIYSRTAILSAPSDDDTHKGADDEFEHRCHSGATDARRNRTLFGQTMGLVAVTAGLFALGAYLGRNMSYGWGWVFWIAGFAALIGMNVVAQRSERGAVTLLFGFGVLIGLASAPTLSYYASTNPQASGRPEGRRPW